MQKNILEELVAMPGVTEQEVRNLCGSLLFRGEVVKRKIELLSGGEKSRVCLGKALLYPSQLLLLDEPTNHLDMESSQALTKALKDYKGTIIFVTHNEEILKQVATRLVLFDGGTIQVLDQTYEKFLKQGGWGDDGEISIKGLRQDSENKQAYLDRKERKKLLISLRTKQRSLEKEIGKLEKKSEENDQNLNDACLAKDVSAIRDLGLKSKDFSIQIENSYKQLEDLMTEEERVSVL